MPSVRHALRAFTLLGAAALLGACAPLGAPAAGSAPASTARTEGVKSMLWVGNRYTAGLPADVAAHLQSVARETSQGFHAREGRGGL